MRRKFSLKSFFCGLVALILALFSPVSVFADLDLKTIREFSLGDILYYDPNGGDYDDGSFGSFGGYGGVGNCGTSGGAVSGGKVTVIGDSISVGARSQYDKQISGVDYSDKTYNGVTYQITQYSKHFEANASGNYSGLKIAEEMEKQGDLRTYVVFALGTNDPGSVTDASIDRLMDVIGTNHKVVLTTNYALEGHLDYSVNNSAIKSAASRYAGKIVVADWAAAVDQDATKYIDDYEYYVHPNEAGSELFVKTIKEALSAFGEGGDSGGSRAVSGSNKNYAGVQVWSDAEIEAIERNRPIYEEAAKEYGFPWQVLAVLHSQETELLRYNPPNGQGIYQLYVYTAGGTNANSFLPSGEVSEEEFLRQTKIAAKEISGMVGDLNNEGNIKKLFFQYNGTAKEYIQKALDMGFSQAEAENGEGSYYVMNRYDARRDPTSADMDSHWPGRFVADGVYDANATSEVFGAFVKYAALAGVSSDYCENGMINNSIAETALLLPWEGRRSHAKDDPKPEYVEAMKVVGAYQMAYDGRPFGASCDQFVGTVLRYSGADPDFPIWGPGAQESWMVQHPDMYQKVETGGDFSTLQPGDIFVTNTNGDHIYLYVGDIKGDGQLWQASASANDRTGEHFVGVYFSDGAGVGGSSRPYSVYRRVNY